MQFEIAKSIEVLERTPTVLTSLLKDLSEEWTQNNEGEETWSPFDIIGHLIQGEKTDWITRTKIILNKENRAFEPFDRFAQIEENIGKSMLELLNEFENLRAKNLIELKALNIGNDQLKLKGSHPELGMVNLKNLLSAWTVHDLGHIAQITRVMAKQYSSEVGVWYNYLGILKQ